MFKKLLHITLILLYINQSLWGASGSTKFPFPPKKYQTTVTLTNAATTPTDTNTQIFQLSIANKTASSCTILVTDRQTSAMTILPTVTIAANTIYIVSWPEGFYAPSGVSWTASANSCLDVQMKALYE